MTVGVSHVRSSRAIVVGSGIAGLTAALHLGECAVVTKTRLGDGSSRWAQGGIAAAVGADDAPSQHATDTLAVSGGLGDARIADLVAESAPSRVRWLRSLGAAFDLDGDGHLALGREAGHHRRRIVHAGGDATGAEIMRALATAVSDRADIDVFADAFAIDLIHSGDRVAGVLLAQPDGRLVALLAPAVILATGGIGRVYASTTNPPEATGDGLAMAARAGAVLENPEFVQFHPTALDASLDPKPLLTEALRGEGALLVDEHGHRYLVDEHPAAELAPRDIVARANWRARLRGPIYLDARPIGDRLARRFPTVTAHAAAAGIDPVHELLPVAPAQHYHMGGIRADADGRSSVPGLFTCGEAASTGLHGANRLASNSLLEGLVFGTRTAEAVLADFPPDGTDSELTVPASVEFIADPGGVSAGTGSFDHEAVEVLRETMWLNAGLVRDETGLRHGLGIAAELRPSLERCPVGRNLVTVAELVLQAALLRRESRGGHYRRDCPEPLQPWAVPTVVTIEPEPSTRLELADRAAAFA